MAILSRDLKNAEGVRQLIDRIVLSDAPNEDSVAGVFEYLDVDLHRHHLTQKRPLSRAQIKAIARQVLTGLSNTHGQNIVHTGTKKRKPPP